MSDSKRKIILKKLTAYNTVWHPESTVVFKSQKDRLVIGRMVDKDLIPLDQECLELCDEWNFKPDESLLDEEDNENTLNDDVNNNDEEDANEEEAKDVNNDEEDANEEPKE